MPDSLARFSVLACCACCVCCAVSAVLVCCACLLAVLVGYDCHVCCACLMWLLVCLFVYLLAWLLCLLDVLVCCACCYCWQHIYIYVYIHICVYIRIYVYIYIHKLICCYLKTIPWWGTWTRPESCRSATSATHLSSLPDRPPRSCHYDPYKEHLHTSYFCQNNEIPMHWWSSPSILLCLGGSKSWLQTGECH